MLHFIQFLKGYLWIRVWGYSPERFMNLCGNHNILLWNIRNHGSYYSMCMTVDGFRRIRPIVKKTGTKAVIQKRCGLPFSISAWKRRKVFLAGLVGSIGFWIWMSAFVWAVEIQGNTSVSTDIFMDFLQQNQIYVGMKKGDLDMEWLEQQIRQDFEMITWTSVRMNGTKLEIQLKENEAGTSKLPSVSGQEAESGGSDLVADRDGVIVRMITRKGVPAVSVGDQVKKGDLLVSGGVPVYEEDGSIRRYQVYEADADIFLQHSLQQSIRLPLYAAEKQYTGEEQRYLFLSLPGKSWEIGLPGKNYEQYDKVTEKKQVRLLENFYLPFFYGSSTVREYIISRKEYTAEEVKKIFSGKLSVIMQDFAEKGVEIIGKNVTINKVPPYWQMAINFEIIEQTGTRVRSGAAGSEAGSLTEGNKAGSLTEENGAGLPAEGNGAELPAE